MPSVVISAILAWGALSFGGVYPWGYWPLLAGCATVGLIGLASRGGAALNRPIALGLMAVGIGVVIQLTPVSQPTLARLSPATDNLLRRYEVLYATAAAGLDRIPESGELSPAVRPPSHALSINPQSTRLGLAFLAGLGVFLLGATRLLTPPRVRALVVGLIALGVVMALVGIVQKATFNGRIYGFWALRFGGRPFGPFVNGNHFAGWMLMALPPAIGYFCALLSRGMRGCKPGWRNRVLWFSSYEASRAVLVGSAILLMGLSLVMTLSRSGITCFAIALVSAGWLVASRRALGARRPVAIAYLMFLALVTVGWAGVDAIATRFSERHASPLGGRLGPWQDAIRVVRDFPLAGAGLNTYGTATLFYQTVDLQSHYVEAHNDYLQLAAEGGVLLGVPAIVLLGLFVREVRRRFREGRDDRDTYWIRLGAVTGLLAIALQEVGEFSLQMPGNAALFAVLSAMAIHRSPLK